MHTWLVMLAPLLLALLLLALPVWVRDVLAPSTSPFWYCCHRRIITACPIPSFAPCLRRHRCSPCLCPSPLALPQTISVIVAAVLRLCIYPRERDFENFQEGEQGGGEGRPANSQIQVGATGGGGGWGMTAALMTGVGSAAALRSCANHVQQVSPVHHPPACLLPAAPLVPPCPPGRCRSCSRA
jgi:hypothetical protein